LQPVGLPEQLGIMPFAFFQGGLRRFALAHLEVQVAIRCRQLDRTPAERLDDVAQIGSRLVRAGVRLLERNDRLGKKASRPLDEGVPFGRRATGQEFADERLLVQLGQVERLQPGRQRLTAHPPR